MKSEAKLVEIFKDFLEISSIKSDFVFELLNFYTLAFEFQLAQILDYKISHDLLKGVSIDGQSEN